jgi:hypothetical protein
MVCSDFLLLIFTSLSKFILLFLFRSFSFFTPCQASFIPGLFFAFSFALFLTQLARLSRAHQQVTALLCGSSRHSLGSAAILFGADEVCGRPANDAGVGDDDEDERRRRFVEECFARHEDEEEVPLAVSGIECMIASPIVFSFDIPILSKI